MNEWRRLEREVPNLGITWKGGLIWDLPPDEIESFAVQHASWGYDIRRVGRTEAERIEPQLASPPELALHAAGEGALEPLAAALALLSAAERLGAMVMPNRAALSLSLCAGRVTGVEIASGRLEADHVVLAAGIETAALAATAGVDLPMKMPPGLLVVTKPQRKLLNGLVLAPEMHLRQTAEGRLVAAGDFDPGIDAETAADELFETMKGMIVSGASLALEAYAVTCRPVPKDGFPVIGPVPGIGGLYVAAMHSGITLAAAVGGFIADENVAGCRDPLLGPYGPGRFYHAKR